MRRTPRPDQGRGRPGSPPSSPCPRLRRPGLRPRMQRVPRPGQTGPRGTRHRPRPPGLRGRAPDRLRHSRAVRRRSSRRASVLVSQPECIRRQDGRQSGHRGAQVRAPTLPGRLGTQTGMEKGTGSCRRLAVKSLHPHPSGRLRTGPASPVRGGRVKGSSQAMIRRSTALRPFDRLRGAKLRANDLCPLRLGLIPSIISQSNVV